VARGTLIGEVRNGASRLAIHSPFRGQVDVWLVWDGQIVAPGQPLCSLRLLPGTAGGP
jgi:multidrug resistance efflux pump